MPCYFQAQYRYAQAFFEMGNFTRAKEVNRAACKICTDKKDLESQFEKFEKGIKGIVVGGLMFKSGLCILLEG